jgi:3-oxoacyl-(acyl-carrier-protein) synthase
MTNNERRVVVTGLGVLAPNGYGLVQFENALRNGTSGIRKIEKSVEFNLRCQVGGVPQNVDQIVGNYLSDEDLLAMNEAMIFGAIAAVDAWKDAGLEVPDRKSDHVNWDAGCVLGSGLSGIDTIGSKLVPMMNAGKVRRMGSTMVEQTMSSSISAKLSGLLALGNQVTSNSSACNTGTEAIHDSYLRIKSGKAEKMLAGGSESASPYIWGGFDAMRVLNSDSNEAPEKASRPMSATAGGFIPGSGCGVVLLESLESAQNRGARIYAEILSAEVNCGGHRNGGSMTAPNSESVLKCIKQAIHSAGIDPTAIDAINGHLTATMADPLEVANWSKALGLGPGKLPAISSTKSLIGHCLGAAGSIEAVASVLQLHKGFIHGSVNCEDLHPSIEPFASSVVRETRNADIKTLAKASFGFGDVNGCLIFRKWE